MIDVTLSDGRVVPCRRLNGLVIVNLLKGFPAIAQKEGAATSIFTFEEMVGGAEYQKAVIQKGTENYFTDDAYEKLEAPDANLLSGVILGQSDMQGAQVAEARTFRNGSHDGGDGGRAGAAVPHDAVGAPVGESAVAGA